MMRYAMYMVSVTALLTGAYCGAMRASDAVRAAPTAVEVSTQTPGRIVVTTEYVPTRELVAQLSTNDIAVLVDVIEDIGMQDSGSRYVLRAFEPLLAHPDVRVREAVLDAVFGFDIVSPLLPALAERLNDPNEDIRDDAMDVLAEVEKREMMDVLILNMTNRYEDVRENCDFYLAFWTDEEFTNAYDWMAWWSSNRATFIFE